MVSANLRKDDYKTLQMPQQNIKNILNPSIVKNTSYLIILISILFFIGIIWVYLPRLHSTRYEGWITPIQLGTTCYDSNTNLKANCNVNIMPLNDGRYRIEVKDFLNKTLQINANFQNPNITYAIVRTGISKNSMAVPDNIYISSDASKPQSSTNDSLDDNSRKRVEVSFNVIPNNTDKKIIIKDASHQKIDHGLILDEVGFLNHSLQNEGHSIHERIYNGIIRFQKKLWMLSCLAFIFLSFRKSEPKIKVFLLVNFTFFLITSTSLLGLWGTYSPVHARDLRTYNGSGTVQEPPGSNLNYGAYMALNISQGNGPVAIPRQPAWARMPGYGYVLSIMTPFMNKPLSILDILVNSIFLQVFLFAITSTYFIWAAGKLFPLWVTAILIGAINLDLHYLQLDITQIEGMMPVVILFMAGNSCLFLNKYKDNDLPPLFYHLLFHLGFLIWFLIRADIIPGWLIISFILYIRPKNWKYLLIPILMLFTSGLLWALWKKQYTHEFSMTTNSIGASLMVGLWDLPNKFIWVANSDATYINWIRGAFNLDFTSKHASNIAVQEVIRFYFTYPLYIIALAWHKFIEFINMKLCVGSVLFWLFIMTTSFTINYKSRQTLILGLPVFFNIPVFFLSFASLGRFYLAPAVILMITSIPLILDIGFYLKILQRPLHFLATALIFILIAWKGAALDNHFIKNEKLLYYAPFLDPNKSTLNIVK